MEAIIESISKSIENNFNDYLEMKENIDSLDSLEFMTLISAIEKEFEIEFRDDITFDELSNYETLIAEIKKELCRHS